MTFDPEVTVDPAALEKAVRKADFTPTGVRLWVAGALERWEPPVAGLADRVLVSSGNRQRFALAPGDAPGSADTLAALLDGAARRVVVTGRVERMEGVDEIVLRVEPEAVHGIE